jgi:hypothetical protein
LTLPVAVAAVAAAEQGAQGSEYQEPVVAMAATADKALR